MSSTLALYSQVLHKFPHKHIKFAFAYGSGVFDQLENSNKAKNMIDFVFVVDDPIKFHDANLRANPSHYSFMRYLGPYYLSRVQNNFGAACYSY
jgi:translocator assembly and maintenance protein 41